MDFNALKAQLDAARRFETAIGPATYRLKLPTEHAWACMLEHHRDAAGRLLENRAFREVLNTALEGWDGVRTIDVHPDAADEPLPFSAEAREALLDVNVDVADQLTIAMGLKLRERREKREAARKNSSRASSGI